MDKTMIIGDLALRLHQTGEPTLRLDLPPSDAPTGPTIDDGYMLHGGVIEFTSLADRNRYVAAHAFAQLDTGHDEFPQLLFAKARELWRDEICHDDKASGRLLATASASLDVIATTTHHIKEGEDLWDTLHLLEAAIPYLAAIKIDSLIELCDIKFDKTKNDLAGGMFHNIVEQWYATRSQEAVRLHTQTLQRLSEASASLLGNATLALATADFELATELVLQDTNSDDATRSGAGIWAAGRLLQVAGAPDAQVARLQDAVLQQLQSARAANRLHAVRAAATALVVTDAFDTALKQLCVAGDQDTLIAVAERLWVNSDHFGPRADLPDWLELMPALRPSHGRSMNDLDHALAQFVKRSELQAQIVVVLGKWAEQNGRGGRLDKQVADGFPSTIGAIGRHEGIRRSLVTSWLLSDGIALPASLQSILQQWPESQTVKLDMEQVNMLDQAGLVFLVRRILGYLHDRFDMTSLALSLLESENPQARIYPILRTVLMTEIGYDYPGGTIEACQKVAQEMPEHAEFLLQIAERLEQADAALAALPRVKELMPPIRLRRLFATARAKQMGDAYEEASKNSIWRQIATEISVKAGRGTFAYQNNAYSEPTQMQAFSHSIELPRREVFDPVGNAIRGLQYRVVKRGEQ